MKAQALILGAGKSGLAAEALLRRRGWDVTLSDQKFGEQKPELLSGMKRLVLSPGVPLTHPVVQAARSQRLEIFSEIDLAFEEKRWPIIAITGTNGKSTTCALVAHLLNAIGFKALAVGNIGTPLCSVVETLDAETILSLELSSYQLEQSQFIRPDVAIVTSLTPDHLARHGNLKSYIEAKWRIFEGMGSKAPKILTEEAAAFARAQGVLPPGDFILIQEGARIQTWGLQSPHDQLNSLCAVTGVSLYTGKSFEEVAKHCASFPGLEHRCEWFGSVGERRIINDSKSTNVDATRVALRALSRPCVLMLGGQGKGESFVSLLQEKGVIARVIAFGAEGEKIERELTGQVPVRRFPTLEKALGVLLTETLDADVLFSPGCASFDEFKNFEDRGMQFKDRFRGHPKFVARGKSRGPTTKTSV